MVSSNEVDFDLRKRGSQSRNILHIWGITHPRIYGTANEPIGILSGSIGYLSWTHTTTSPKVSTGHLQYPVDVRDSAKSGLGQSDNHHLHCLVESISVNVGGPQQNAKASSLPMSVEGVGAAIVVRGWESQPHGEGPQSVGISNADGNRMLTRGRKLL